jgi:enoyl-[acyl-carrier protein] reductase I
MQSVALFSVASAWTAALPSSYAPVQYAAPNAVPLGYSAVAYEPMQTNGAQIAFLAPRSAPSSAERLGNFAVQSVALLSICGLGALAGMGLRRAQTTLAVGGDDGMRPQSLKGKKAFVAGIGDDQGYGWAIAHALAEEGCEIIVGTWAPIVSIYQKSWDKGSFDESRKLSNGKMMEMLKLYPIDAAFDVPDDVPEETKENKRYKGLGGYTVSEVAAQVEKDFGKIDILVHSLANGPEVKNPLLETSRAGYLAAVSASSYSFVSLVKYFGPVMNKGGSVMNLTYLASEKVVPGYGGGMSSAKAALESDTRVLAYEAGRKWGIRINTISAGALGSRAARAIGFIGAMIEYQGNNAPLQKDLAAAEVGTAAQFLLGPGASAITGVTLYVDNGLHAMAIATDSPSLETAVA